MKKVLYSLAMVVLGLSSCTSWDEPTTENYGAGPSIAVNLSAATPSDSAFSITVTPGEGTTYYSFVIDQNDEDETAALDATTLLKGSYGGYVLNTSDYPTLSTTIKGLTPNTTYQVYAVASNDKGIVGTIVNASIKTTDTGAPQLIGFNSNRANKVAQVGFNQAVTRGAGAISGIYYKEWDWENPVTLAEDDITVSISGSTVSFTADVPAGAYVAFSWAEGAFIDAVGNKCAAYTSTIDEEEFDLVGAWVHVANEAFAISDKYVTPTSGSKLGDWEDVTLAVTFPFDIYRDDESVKQGDVQVVYVNDGREVAYNLKGDQWSVNGKVLNIKLPVEPTVGDEVLFFINEGVIADVYGNGNEEYVSENIQLIYAGFIPTKEMVLGDFNYSVTLSSGASYNLGAITIESNPNNADSIVVKDLWLEGSEIEGVIDLGTAQVFVDHLSYLGQEDDEEEDGTVTTYNIYTYDNTGNKAPYFDINKDGTLTSSNLILVGNPVGTNDLYYWLRPTVWTLERPAAQARAKAKTHFTGKRGAKLKAKLK